jgi:bacteriorhodopsin
VAFTSWRWAVSLYNGLGAIAMLPVLRCAFSPSEQVINDSFCRLWLEPAWAYKASVHPNTRAYFLGFLALVALVIYVLLFGYFVFFRLGKQGRSALE